MYMHYYSMTMDVLLFVASSTLVSCLVKAQRNENSSSMGQSSSKNKNTSTQESSKQSLLLQAAMQGDLAQIQALVAEHHLLANTTTTTQDDDTNSSIASFLQQPDAAGNAAIHGAVFGGHLEVVRYLHEQQELQNSTSSNAAAAAAAAAADTILTLPNGLGCTPLWLAAGYNHAAILEYLLQHISISKQKEALLAANSTGDTPLLAAASKGHAAICIQLLEAARRVHCAEQLAQTVNQGGDSPLAVAIAADNIKDDGALLDQLIQLSNAKLSSSSSSSSSDSSTSTSTILHRPNAKGITPLLLACERDHVVVVQKLLPLLTTTTMISSNGDTPMGVAAFCGSEKVLKVLLLNSSNSNSSVVSSSLLLINQPHQGCTPLFLAVRAGHVNCARLLLEAGADASIPNGQGLTPRQAAAKRPEMIALLEQYSPNNANKSSS